MTKTGTLYILSGASGCGKTTLLNSVAAEGIEAVDSELNAVRAPKFSERKVRTGGDGPDDITTLETVNSDTVNIPYVINNVRYGVRLEPIRQILDQGLNAFIILSDLRVVRQVLAGCGESRLSAAARFCRLSLEENASYGDGQTKTSAAAIALGGDGTADPPSRASLLPSAEPVVGQARI